MKRLHPDELATLAPRAAQPRYARSALRGGIVHLGVGAFQRAHLAVYTEAAIHRSGDLRWGTVGVSLRRPDTRDALRPQGGLYTVAIRDADDEGRWREALQIVGNLIEVLVAPECPSAVLERIAHPDTRIVSMTVTEKGYGRDPASGALRLDDPDIAHDLSHSESPRTALGFLARGLQLRRQRLLGPITLMSLDNLPSNGRSLQRLLLAFAERVDAGLKGWIAAGCTFPDSMVDRIVPRTTHADCERISERIGLRDAWPVIAEPFTDWAVEDRFAAGRPDWASGGARFVDAARPFETLKLRMVNGTHSALAYLGAMAGFATVDRAIAQPAMRDYIAALMREEIEPTLPSLPEVDLDHYRERLLQRYANPALQHQTLQIAMDGSQKLPQRLLVTVRDRLRVDASIERLALAVAAWLHHLRGVDEAGNAYEIQDPLAEALAARIAQARSAAAGIADSRTAELRRIEVLLGFDEVLGDLGDDPRVVKAVARGMHSLRELGVLATLQAWA